jgi:hypothetical protein
MDHLKTNTNCKYCIAFIMLSVFFLLLESPLLSQTIVHKFSKTKSKYIYYFEDKSLKIKSKEYDSIRPFREGRALVGNRVKRSSYKYFWNILNKKFKEILPIDSSRIMWSDFFEGYAFIDSKTNWGFIDKNGKYYPNDYSTGTFFQGGIAKTYVDKTVGGQNYQLGETEQNPFGFKINYVNHKFEYLIPNKFDTISDFQEGELRLVGKGGKYGFLDTLGELKIPISLDRVIPYYWNSWSLVEKNKMYAFIDIHTGENPLKEEYESVYPSRLPFAWVQKNRKWGAIYSNGKIKFPFIYNSLIQFDSSGRSIVQKGKYFGIIDSSHRTIVPFKFERIFEFSNGLALIQREKKFGFINRKWEEIIEAKYITATSFTNGYALVDNGFWIERIDTSGDSTISSFNPPILIVFLLIFVLIAFIVLKK